MKNLLLAGCLLIAGSCFAQKASIDGDTISYNGKKYVVGDTLTLAYGSQADKSFSYVTFGTALTGTKPLGHTFSKSTVIIDKVYKQSGKCFLRAKVIETKQMGKAFIDVEGAVDNKEIIEKS